VIDRLSDAWLVEAAGGDAARLESLRQRVREGEPAGYVAGFIRFRGLRLAIDRRAFITDAETSLLVDVALAEGRALQRELGRAPQVLEFGVGAGSLSLAMHAEQPDWHYSGLDVDAPALELAAQNAAAHGCDLALFRSEYIDGWPAERAPPDLIFGDPPWGSRNDLYDAQRDAAYYDAMPAASAYPRAGRTAIHDQLLRRLVARGWRSRLVLNYGVLPVELIARSALPLSRWQLVHPRPEISVLVGQALV
jgi:methylase of polypeptide subunit release factors